MERLLGLVPEAYGRYYEPFVGGGALFFALQPATASLGDKNGELINVYRCIRDDHERLSKLLGDMPQNRGHYYVVRDQQPRDQYQRAARTIYLTSLAFNGIHRVNRQGRFNVPFGDRPYPGLGAIDALEPYAAALTNAQLQEGDFADTLKTAAAGDLVYLDPPYTVAHSNNGFVKYNAKIFLSDDQERLAGAAYALAERGCHVIISNAYHTSIKELYRDFSAIEVRRRSVMAASSNFRKEVTEYLFTNAPEDR